MYNVCIMSSQLLSIKVDEQTKKELKIFASELGVTSTAFVNMVIKQALRDRRIVLTADLEPTPRLQRHIAESDEDYRAKRVVTAKTPSDAKEHLQNLINNK